MVEAHSEQEIVVVKQDPETKEFEPFELQDRKVYHFECLYEQYARFFFEIKEPAIVQIDTWPLNDQSDPDLYVAYDDPKVSKENFTHKSNMIGSDRVILYPDTASYTLGTMWIGIEGFRQTTNKLAVQIRFKDYRKVHELIHGVSKTCTVQDVAFFKYQINSKADFE